MNKVAKATVSLMMATMMAKILGFFREIVLAANYGASMYSDAYLISMNIPNVLFALICAAVGATFIPIYFEIDNNLKGSKSLKFTNNMLNIIILICIVMTILGLIFTEPLVKLFAYGFSKNTFNITVNFTRILIIGMIFSGISSIMTAYLQARNNFIIPGIVSIPYNLIIIISIILSIKNGPYTIVWGTLIAIASQCVFQIPFAYKLGYKYDRYIDIHDKYIKKSISLIVPVFIGIAADQINNIIDKSLASNLQSGSISALNYASKLNTFITALFITSIVTVIYPHFSKLSNNENLDEFKEMIVKSINSVILLTLPISIGAIILSKPIVKVLFQRGNFDLIATEMTAQALMMYSVGISSFGIRDILGRIFYSLKDTKIPMINGAIAMVINIILNILLVRKLELLGLALATSISSIIGVILLFINLNKKVGYFGQDRIFKTVIKSAISSSIMGFFTAIVYKYMIGILNSGFIHELIALFLSIVIGVIVYGTMTYLLKVEEVIEVSKILKLRKNTIKSIAE